MFAQAKLMGEQVFFSAGSSTNIIFSCPVLSIEKQFKVICNNTQT